MPCAELVEIAVFTEQRNHEHDDIQLAKRWALHPFRFTSDGLHAT